MSDSEYLRSKFELTAEAVPDGWEVLSEGDDGDYGNDLLMYLRGPDGLLYCIEFSCCSCGSTSEAFPGDVFDPVETNVETIEKDYAQLTGDTFSYPSKARAAREALAKLGVDV